MPLVTSADITHTRVHLVVTRPFTFIIRRFTTGSHYRMQIRGVPKAEGQSRGLVKTHRTARLPRTPRPYGQVRVRAVRAFDTTPVVPAAKAEFKEFPYYMYTSCSPGDVA